MNVIQGLRILRLEKPWNHFLRFYSCQLKLLKCVLTDLCSVGSCYRGDPCSRRKGDWNRILCCIGKPVFRSLSVNQVVQILHSNTLFSPIWPNVLQSAVTLDRLLIWKHLWVIFLVSRWPHWRLWNQQNPRLQWHTSLTWCWKGWIFSIWTFPRINPPAVTTSQGQLKEATFPFELWNLVGICFLPQFTRKMDKR